MSLPKLRDKMMGAGAPNHSRMYLDTKSSYVNVLFESSP